MIDTQTTLTYPHYKTTDQVWLGEIPKHWMLLANKYIFKLSKTQVGKNAPNYDLLSLTLKGVIKRNMVNPEGKFPAEFDTYQEVRRGDFIFCLFDVEETPRTVGLSDFEGMITGAYTVMHVNESFSKRFLFYLYFNLDVGKRLKFLYKGLRNTISKDSFFSFKIPIPPLPEQQAIAAYLDDKTDKIDTAIAQKQKLIELLKERKQIVIQELVTGKKVWDESKQTWVKPTETFDSGIEWIGEIPKGWEVKRLKYSSKIFRGKFTHRPRNDERLYGGSYPFFQTGDVAKADQFLKDYKQTLNEKGLKVSILIPKGTIVITIAANIGDVAILGIDACFPDSIVGFYPTKNVAQYFLFYCLMAMKQQFVSSTIKNTQMNLNVERIGNNSIVFPDFEQQTQIIQEIQTQSAKIDQSISLQEQQIEKLKEYKKVLIDEVVRGKRRVPSAQEVKAS